MPFGTSFQRVADVREIIKKVIDELSVRAASSIHIHFRMENRPFSLHREPINAFSIALLNRMKQYRCTESAVNAAGYNPFASVASPNEYDTEMALIASVLAYVKISVRRVADIIPMSVEEELQDKLADKIGKQLKATFLDCEDRDEKCAALLVDDPAEVAKREELSRKMEILKLATQELMKVEAFHE
jgi:hypothetical protein